MARQSNNDNIDDAQTRLRARIKEALDTAMPMLPATPDGQGPPMIGGVVTTGERSPVTINMTFIIGGKRGDGDGADD